MMVIPLSRKSVLNNFMPITILLILINCCVFFGIQRDDARYGRKAMEFYRESGLRDIERDSYIAHKYTPEQQDAINQLDETLKKERLYKIYLKMWRDRDFMEKLKRGEIITPATPEYYKWKRLRAAFAQKLLKVVAQKYGFKPAHPNLMNAFNSMFLHGDTGHLIGNMIFLWLVGCLLEMKCGGKSVLLIYLLTGLGSTGLFWVFNSNSSIPCIGASGAISGLMGALAVVYGWQRVSVFFTVGFYFNYLKIPAIILLPFWVGKEIFYEIAFGDVSNIAYMAHLGGLLSGALLGFIHRQYRGRYKDDIRDPEAETAQLLEKALAHIRRLEMDKGIELLNSVLDRAPAHIVALKHLFHIHKVISARHKPLHDVTKRLLSILVKDRHHHAQAAELYAEYIRWADRPVLPAALYLRLMPILATHGRPETAERILGGFLKKKPDFPGLSAVLLKLANTFKAKGDYNRQTACLAVLQTKFSDSTEAWLAQEDLRSTYPNHSPLTN
jgi:membrane associated rhomboid family serine protease